LSRVLLNVFSDVDGEPINLDDSVCDQIVFAAEALQYVELSDGAMPPGTSSYDMDTGTPDHMTSSSDPDVVQVSDVGCYHACQLITCARDCMCSSSLLPISCLQVLHSSLSILNAPKNPCPFLKHYSISHF